LLGAVLAAPADAERSLLGAFSAEAAREGLDSDDVSYVLMACTLIDDRDDDRDDDREAA
jgi:hypothetical protein